MSAALHPCPGGCGHPIHAGREMCEPCGRRLPWWIKAQIVETRQARNQHPGDEGAQRAYRAAVERAGRWYREHPRGHL